MVEVYAICPHCARLLKKERSKLGVIIDNHNEQRHDGEEVARFLETKDDLNEAMKEARENLGEGPYRKVVRAVLRKGVIDELAVDREEFYEENFSKSN